MTYRLSRPRLFLTVASLYGARSSCSRAQVGVIALREWRIVASGYVGAPRGEPHCLDEECIMEGGGCIRSVHAEANMIAWSAREGISLKDTMVVCTHQPCLSCAKLLLNAGISSFIWRSPYRDERGLELLKRNGIKTMDSEQFEVAWD